MTYNNDILSWKNYLELCKPKVVALIIFTAIVGMLLAVEGIPPLEPLLYATIGIGLAASSAAAINHYIDRQSDAKMARTKNRPLPQGNLSAKNVIVFALILGVISMLILGILVNLLTAFLTLLSLIGYAIIYTVYLKRMTPQNIVIGGAAGAAPPVLGWCAMTGEVHPFSLLLFLIVFIWTPPHFWALAIARRKEYAKIAIPMLPVTHGVEFTRLQILLYTILLFLVTILPYLTGMSHLIYLVTAVLLGFVFLYFAILMMKRKDDKTAMQTFGFSILYLMLMFAALLIDHYIPLTIESILG
ncbi:MAG: heme o synthase [Methylococcales bacterium]|nr:heme o synthase [Methylococcales bacterium]MCK5897958.1 heme o synthase [Methylococcales bacterium]